MKLLAILLALTATAGATAAEDIVPRAFPKDRYAETKSKSPFVLETKVAEPEVAKVNPFLNLYLRMVSKKDGKDYILIQRIGEERTLDPFIGNEPGPQGYTVKEVRVGSSFRETKVVLQQGTEIGEIGYKVETINAPPAAPQQPRGPGPGGAFKPGSGMQPQQQQQAVRVAQPPMPVQNVPRPAGSVPLPTAPAPVIPATPGAPSTSIRSRGRPVGN